MSQRNVVNLSQFDKSRNVLSAAEVLFILHQCRDQLCIEVDRVWNERRGQIEDDLLNFADRSPLLETRNLYYAVQNLLRNRNESLSVALRSQFVMQFDKQIQVDAQVEKTASSVDLNLSLVDEAAFEESLALSKTATRMQASAVEALAALDQRMAALLNQAHNKSATNPLAPKAVCDAFLEACKVVEATPNMRLVLLQHFDAHLVPAIAAIYQQLNQYLVDKGVLPTIKIGATAPRERHQVASSNNAGGSNNNVGTGGGEALGADGSGIDVFALLQQLLSQQFAQGGHAQAAGQGWTGAAFAPVGGGVPTAMLHGEPIALGAQIATLTSLQRGQYTGMVNAGFDPALIQAGTSNVLRDMRDAGLVQVDNQADSLTIDIVAMLFDYVFDDEHIPAELKALIGRLQIPVLKVAMLDKQFFSKKSHPARRLLDEIARVSVGWHNQGEYNTALYAQINTIVSAVLNDFTDDATVFEHLLLDLQDFVTTHEADAESAVAETAHIIENAERAQLAQVVVQDEINNALANYTALPEVVREFVQTIWQQVLMQAYMQASELGEAWQQAVQTMQNLIWSVMPKLNNEDRLKLVAMLPTLLNQLRDGLQRLDIDSVRRDAIFAGLVACHAVAVKAGLQASVVALNDVEMAKAIEATQVDAPDVLPEMLALDNAVENLDDMLVVAAPSSFETETDEGIDDEYTEQARCLKKGEWLAFERPDGSTRQVRLSWVSGLRGMYLFTNNQGLDAMTIALPRLAARLRAGEARVIKSSSLTERAVERLIGKLQGRG
jgi:hypothetical protein